MGCRAMLDIPLAAAASAFGSVDVPATPTDALNRLDPRLANASAPAHAPQPRPSPQEWAKRIAKWAAAGIAGVRLVGLDHVDPQPLIEAINTACPALTLIAWTPGLPPAVLSHLQGVDFVVSSLPWWDMQAPWLWDEVARLRAIAPVLSCPEAPFGPRVAAAIHDPALVEAGLRRAAGLAFALGDGWIVPAGFAAGSRRAFDIRGHAQVLDDRQADISDAVMAWNDAFSRSFLAKSETPLTSPGEAVLALLRSDAAEPRSATTAILHLANTNLSRSSTLDPARVLSCIDGGFAPFRSVSGADNLRPGTPVVLRPGEVRSYVAQALAKQDSVPKLDPAAALRFANSPRVAIEAPSPCVNDGSLPVKRLAGEVVTIEADILCDGHDRLSAVLRSRGPRETSWTETRMQPAGNDRYTAALPLERVGAYEYTIQAWRDAFATYRDELAKKIAAGLDVSLELREGVALVTHTAQRASNDPDLQARVKALSATDAAGQREILLSSELSATMARVDDRPRAAALPHPIRIDAERSAAAFAAWYEVFPRSMSDDPARHGTFADVERHLPRVRAMGFDVLYFPPVHPIGRTNRKGSNNTLTPSETDPGSPYAIGSAEGGHDALHPELGSFADFRHLIAAAAGHGIEIAIDFAIQCSPDHPWLREHRDWFEWRPDGSIRYAENPPKKYQDIVNVDFYAAGSIPDLWVALANIVLFWCEQGIRMFRVDNPHTKPLPFWQWMIGEVRSRYPDASFLAEAFTRPKVMYRLAKVGFSQSYTYFTWRETKSEMEAYLRELAEPGPRDFFRPHFFVNTPDINPVYLQHAGRAAYVIRAALAATLSGLWGVYNGFELCEGTPIPGREEYLDSEKFQLRAWDWDRPGNIISEITALNRIRRQNPALRTHLNTVFLPAGNDAVTVFEKATSDRGNVLVVAISYDPAGPQETAFEFPFWHWNTTEQAAFDAENLMTGERSVWRGKNQTVRLTPDQPFVIWRIRAAS